MKRTLSPLHFTVSWIMDHQIRSADFNTALELYTSRLQTLDWCNSNSLIWVRFEKSHSHCCLQSDVFQQWLLLPKQLVSCLFAIATISCFLSHRDTDRITNRMTLAYSVSTARQWFIVVGRAPCLVSTMSDTFYLLSGRVT